MGNACGTIALIHAVGNSSSEINLGNFKLLYVACQILYKILGIFLVLPQVSEMKEPIWSIVVENSCLDVFFKSTASMDPYEVLVCFVRICAHYQVTLISLTVFSLYPMPYFSACFVSWEGRCHGKGSLIGRQCWCHRGTAILLSLCMWTGLETWNWETLKNRHPLQSVYRAIGVYSYTVVILETFFFMCYVSINFLISECWAGQKKVHVSLNLLESCIG